MSVFDFPRIHFRGFCRAHVPTGDQNRLPMIDLGSRRVFWRGEEVTGSSATDFQRRIHAESAHFDAAGRWSTDGPFCEAGGWNPGGSGHVAWEDVAVTAVEIAPGCCVEDGLVGTSIDLFGHTNEILATTCNRARWIEGDSTSRWTTMILAGRLAIGRRSTSVHEAYGLSVELEGHQLARWLNTRRLRSSFPHAIRDEIARSLLFQVVISPEACQFGQEMVARCPVLAMLRQALGSGEYAGLVAQYSVFNLGLPAEPGQPGFYDLVGTLAPWRPDEPQSHPAGRVFRATTPALGAFSVAASDRRVGWNLLNAVGFERDPAWPVAGRRTPEVTAFSGAGTLCLRVRGARPVITALEPAVYAGPEFWSRGGLFDSPLLAAAVPPDEPLEVWSLDRRTGEETLVAVEAPWVIESTPAHLWLEHAHPERPEDTDAPVRVRAFHRGRPAAGAVLEISSHLNPNGVVPEAPAGVATRPLLLFCSGDRDAPRVFAPTCHVTTDAAGWAAFSARGVAGGGARIVFRPEGHAAGTETRTDDGAEAAWARPDYDNANLTRRWETASCSYARVLPDDWALEAIAPAAVDFPLVYARVLHYYELIYPFMRDAVFSLRDQCKCETYARLMWQMCDPANRDRTFYMPPTRDLSLPAAHLLRAYLRNVERPLFVETVPATDVPRQRIETRAELAEALRTAAAIELAVMLQYMYAAYSLPGRRSGEEYVRRGLWTPAQLDLVAGDGSEGQDQGWRGLLLQVAHEEMIHHLLANNLLMAIGEPFSTGLGPDLRPCLDFPLDVMVAFQPFGGTALHRFLDLERPAGLDRRLAIEGPARAGAPASLVELYQDIREALAAHPEWITHPRSSGEHHLFMGSRVDRCHPDYQLQVVDQATALFAVDYLREQGEGSPVATDKFDVSHFERFRRVTGEWAAEQVRAPWTPALPVLENPTLRGSCAHRTEVQDRSARRVMRLFNECFRLCLVMMTQHFASHAGMSLRRSRLMNAAIDFMTGLLRPIATRLMTMPSGSKGKSAGPSFELERPVEPRETYEAACRDLAFECRRLAAQAANLSPWVGRSQAEMLELHAALFVRLEADRAARFV